MTNAALEQAATFLSRTDLIAAARQQPLPAGITDLLKICSGDNDVLIAAQEQLRLSQEEVRHAAEFYAQQILFAPESDHYRILGVDPDDVEAKIKLHYRLLVRWLHPDRNTGDWEAVFSERINRAWQALRTPERRREYDEKNSFSNQFSTGLVEPGREIKPVQWRESKSDARFMSSRTIKRLPIAVFSVLGIGALLALWLFSQTQPNLQPQALEEAPLVSDNEDAQPDLQTQATTNAIAAPEAGPMPDDRRGSMVETASNAAPAAVKAAPEIVKAPAPLPESVEPKKPVPAPVIAAAPQTPILAVEQKKNRKAAEKITPPVVVAVASKKPDEEKPVSKRARKSKTDAPLPVLAAPSGENAVLASNTNAVPTKAEVRKEIANDASVKQFLQRFSRVYSEGDYFALHNLFTKDLSILGAPPQRTVLRSYRQLFETSDSREISLDHVTWLTTDEHIVVIASYQAQVQPRGKAEAKSSHGDIRLDLRLENGQLKIIRLQSDSKNG